MVPFLLFLLLPLSLCPLTGDIILRSFPQDCTVSSKGVALEPVSDDGEYRRFILPEESHSLVLEAPGYRPLTLELPPPGKGEKNPPLLEAKLEKDGLPLFKIGEIPTAVQPKSVTFSPDGRYLAVASLGSSRGLQIFRTDPLEHVVDLIPPDRGKSRTGYVESCWLGSRKEVWFSQMDTGEFHVYGTDSWDYRGSWTGEGLWSKVLLANRDETRVYLSHWSSQNVTEIDTVSREVRRSFETSGIPRGLALSPDGGTLLVAIYSADALDYINLETGEVTTRTYSDRIGAMRHIVSDGLRGLHYVTNMARKTVYALSDRTGLIVRRFDVGHKPNTAQISPDGRWLFVSCRGPNNPRTYLIEGPEYGRVYLIDLDRQEVAGWIWGRDQTTGLDVSPDSRTLAFTNFKENTLELYRIDKWKE